MVRKKRQKEDMGHHVIGMDLGGTKILGAVVDPKGRIVSEAKTKTKSEGGPDAVIERIARTARQAARRAKIGWVDVGAVGIGAPGPVDPTTGVVYNPPNLPGWDEIRLGPRLSEALGVPVYVENDVNLGTLGEYTQGAGQGTVDMVGIFVGTGVGGGLILNGQLRSGFRHAAGELGHMIILADGPVCGCGRRGCLESVASRTAIERDIQLGLAAGRESRITEWMGEGGGLTSRVLAQAVRQDDPLVTEIMSRAQWYLGLLTASVVNLVDPEIVVFGGGVAEALGEQFLAPIRVTARQYYIQQAGADRVRIVAAKLGDHAGVLGAAVLARQHGQ